MKDEPKKDWGFDVNSLTRSETKAIVLTDKDQLDRIENKLDWLKWAMENSTSQQTYGFLKVGVVLGASTLETVTEWEKEVEAHAEKEPEWPK